VSLAAPLAVLLRRMRLVVSLALATGIVAGVWVLLTRKYVAESSFRPEGGGGQAEGLARLMGNLGFSLPGVEDPESVDFYSKLLRSRALIGDAVRSTYRVATPSGDSVVGTLVEIYGFHRGGPKRAQRNAEKRLAKRVRVSVDRAANVVTIQARARLPELAEALNRRLLDLVNQFNVESRRSTAAAQRDFLAGRLDESRGELEAAEEELRLFLDKNRLWQDSPELVFEERRLQRRVLLRQELYTTVMEGYEEARMDAVRSTPVITTIQEPEGMAEYALGLGKATALGTVFGLLLAIGLVMLMEYVARQRHAVPEDYSELSHAWRTTLGRFGSRWRRS
jgi:uncharacterized protein involved in exopolysaccharide biosynthesis